LFVIRPGELGLDHPLRIERAPDGREVLWVCGREL
jgi:hypothetical protein